MKSQKNTLHSKCKFLVSYFCSGARDLSWPKQIKIAKQLLQEYPDLSFWENLNLKGQIFCLSFFLTDKGREALFINKKKINLDLEEKKTYNLQEEKVGEDLDLKIKPRNVFDFLKYGKK